MDKMNGELLRKLIDMVETLKNANSTEESKIEKAISECREEIIRTGAMFSLNSVKAKYGLYSAELTAVKKALDKEFEFIGNRKVFAWRVGESNRNIKNCINQTGKMKSMGKNFFPEKLVEVINSSKCKNPTYWTKEEKEELERLVDVGTKTKDIIRRFKNHKVSTVRTFVSGYKKGDRKHYIPSTEQQTFNKAMKRTRAKQRKLTTTELEQFAKELNYGSPLKNVCKLLNLDERQGYYFCYKAKFSGLIGKDKKIVKGQLVQVGEE